MTLDHLNCAWAIDEAHRCLQIAWESARRIGDAELAAYLSDLAADTGSQMRVINKRVIDAVAVEP